MDKENMRILMTVVYLLCTMVLCKAIESPPYAVVHTESDFEIRLYRESTWMSAPVRELSFQKATVFGFHRFFINFFLILFSYLSVELLFQKRNKATWKLKGK